uniref:mitogen-activated protein kinase kinase kinase 3-like n=1 Tax=Styela clava TaxID=7725 RepID=UPI001939F21E|nr:mitogen-activated protein kinase kinase kinase 3-like [Styela clava]
MLGRGAFGAVYGAVDKNGFEFAVKEVPKDGVEEKSLREEVKVLGKLSHTNIVQFYGCAGDNQKIYMYMEIMQGSIKDIIDNSGKTIPQGQARKYTKDLVQGLVYLHQNGVVHNDIKCANVLLDYNGIAKLADMGVSKKHDQETLISYTDEQVGTIAWMSPEVSEGRDSGKRSDVWSMGCTVYEMLKGKPPFVDQLPAILVYTVLPQLIKALEHRKLVGRQEDFSISIKRFLLRIFVRMEDRPLSENIAKDEWLQ